MIKQSRPLPDILRQTGPKKMRRQRIRVSILGINDKKVYLLKSILEGREVWFLPGGSVAWGETLQEAATREANEELGIQVLIKDLIALSDNISPGNDFHSIEAIFLCEYLGQPKANGEMAEVKEFTYNQYAIDGKWFSVSEITKIEAYPKKFLLQFLPQYLENPTSNPSRYLGLDWD